MTHTVFLERLEEIQLDFERTVTEAKLDKNTTDVRMVKILIANRIQATQSLITLFEDYTKAIVPKEERAFPDIHETWLRQTINQTSKTILRGESDES